MNILIIVVLCVYLAINIVTSKMLTVKEMQHKFVDGQCIVGKIATNAFYSIAWLLKGLRFIIINTVK